MSKELSPLQQILLEACEGFDIETRELLKALTHDVLVSIKEGELTANDLREIARDIAESKNDVDQTNPRTHDSAPPNNP